MEHIHIHKNIDYYSLFLLRKHSLRRNRKSTCALTALSFAAYLFLLCLHFENWHQLDFRKLFPTVVKNKNNNASQLKEAVAPSCLPFSFCLASNYCRTIVLGLLSARVDMSLEKHVASMSTSILSGLSRTSQRNLSPSITFWQISTDLIPIRVLESQRDGAVRRLTLAGLKPLTK